MIKTIFFNLFILVWFNFKLIAQIGNCYIDKDFQIKILTNYLNRLKEINNSGNWKSLHLNKNYKIGSTGKEIKSVKNNLQLLNYYPQNIEIKNDSLDLELQKAIKNFQYYHHIDTTGTLGLKTRNKLNQPLDELIKIVEWNIKQWQQSELNHYENFIFINIAECHLKVIENKNIKLEMKVIVGRPSRPSFELNSEIDGVEFYPYWVVPPGILRKDVIPQFEKDRKFLSKNNFEILTWLNEPLNFIPEPNELTKYKVQQPPGKKNPLGKVKFNFKNKNFMFLHDTPNKYLFKNYPSAYSSGCIRLEKAEELTFYLLSKNCNYSKPEIESFFINEKNKSIKFKNTMSLKIHYFTIWANEKDELFFADDIYKRVNN